MTRQSECRWWLPQPEAGIGLVFFFYCLLRKVKHMLKRCSSSVGSGFRSPFRLLPPFAHFLHNVFPFHLPPLRSRLNQGKTLFIPSINAPALARSPLAARQANSLSACLDCPAAACPCIPDRSVHYLVETLMTCLQACSRSGSPRKASVPSPGRLRHSVGASIVRHQTFLRCPSLSLRGAAANTKKIPH